MFVGYAEDVIALVDLYGLDELAFGVLEVQPDPVTGGEYD